ncbi:TPA: transcription elongation factor Spt5 [Candidatus Bathyarchaeota archaeon]|nr:transcription elongation factor Spt5 [Candidatus Bathyarchaeota archaeon]
MGLAKEAEEETQPQGEASGKAVEAKLSESQIYVVKTTSGQEANVANLIYMRALTNKLPIYAVMVAEGLKGYVFVEAAGPHFVDDASSGIKHVKQRLPGVASPADLERYLLVKPVVEELNVDDMVEVVGGPLKGMKAKIVKVDKVKNEVTLELLEAAVTMPITVNADYVRLVGRGRREREE